MCSNKENSAPLTVNYPFSKALKAEIQNRTSVLTDHFNGKLPSHAQRPLQEPPLFLPSSSPPESDDAFDSFPVSRTSFGTRRPDNQASTSEFNLQLDPKSALSLSFRKSSAGKGRSPTDGSGRHLAFSSKLAGEPLRNLEEVEDAPGVERTCDALIDVLRSSKGYEAVEGAAASVVPKVKGHGKTVASWTPPHATFVLEHLGKRKGMCGLFLKIAGREDTVYWTAGVALPLLKIVSCIVAHSNMNCEVALSSNGIAQPLKKFQSKPLTRESAAAIVYHLQMARNLNKPKPQAVVGGRTACSCVCSCAVHDRN